MSWERARKLSPLALLLGSALGLVVPLGLATGAVGWLSPRGPTTGR